MILTLADVDAVFDAMLSGRITRDEADRWAAECIRADRDGELQYQPPEQQEAIWRGITYLNGIDLMDAPGVFLHNDDDIRAEQKRIFGTNELMLAQSEILDFWFSITHRKRWFDPTEAFDREITKRFRPIYDRALPGELDAWRDQPRGALALVILLDQFPRNMFRGTPGAFASDPLALWVAAQAIEQGFDSQVEKDERSFFYLPFMHSEEIADQERSVALFTAHGDESGLDYAIRHRDIVARFGRFPHRNEVLGRESTPEEIEFLKQPGSRF